MSSVGSITLVWGNGEDQFCIAKIGELLALEDKCNAGIMTIMHRIQTEAWYVNDIRETIRLGLIGGGMSAEKAMIAVKLHVDGHPLMQSVLLAHAILAAAIVGVPDDQVGKEQAAEAETEAKSFSEPMAASAAPSSSVSEPPSDGVFPTPTTQPSGNSRPVSPGTTAPTATAPSRPSP